jgi:hypothetical protein
MAGGGIGGGMGAGIGCGGGRLLQPPQAVANMARSSPEIRRLAVLVRVINVFAIAAPLTPASLRQPSTSKTRRVQTPDTAEMDRACEGGDSENLLQAMKESPFASE